MKILIIGGTRFFGRHLVETALSRGHEITLFNRGRTNPALFPQVETIHGDRETDLEKLSGRTGQAVIDTSAYVPRIVRMPACRYFQRDRPGLPVEDWPTTRNQQSREKRTPKKNACSTRSFLGFLV